MKLWDRSPHPASPTSPRQFHELCRSLEAMGMGALGHAGHGCYPAWRKGGQSLPVPCKAAPTPDQHAFPLPRCPQAPPPCGARLGWLLCPLTADTAPSGAGGCWRWEEAPPQLTLDGAMRPCLCPLAQPCRGGTMGPIRSRRRQHSWGFHGRLVTRSHMTARGKGRLGVGAGGDHRQGLWVLGGCLDTALCPRAGWATTSRASPTCISQLRLSANAGSHGHRYPGAAQPLLPCLPPRPCLPECLCQGKVPAC